MPGGSVSVNNTGNITVNEGGGIETVAISATSFGGDVSVVNAGDLNALGDGSVGISLHGDGDSALSVNNIGDIAAGSVGIQLYTDGIGAVSAINTGNINAGETGIELKNNGAGDIFVENSGAININGLSGAGIDAESDGLGNVHVVNDGEITVNNASDGVGISVTTGHDDDVEPGAGVVIVENSAAILVTGNFSAGIFAGVAPDGDAGTATITTSANVTATGSDSYGIFAFGVGSTVVNIGDGATVSGGSGGTEFAIQNYVTVYQPGETVAVNVIINSPEDFQNAIQGAGFFDDDLGQRFTGSSGVLFIGAGENVLNNSGTITSLNGLAVSAFSGTISGFDIDYGGGGPEGGGPTAVPFELTLPAGNETVNNDGTITGDIALGEGDNTLNNNAGTLTGNLTTGSGVDTVNNSGTLVGDANLGDGGNFFTNLLDGIFGGDLTTGADNDTVANAGEMKDGNSNLGEGTNSFTNTGTVTGNVTTGDGNDSYQNDGTHTGDVALGGGTNTIGNTSNETLTGNVTTGNGDDTYDNSGTQTGNVALGDGTNRCDQFRHADRQSDNRLGC